MAMGIPVITNNGVGDVSDIVQKYNAGFVAEDFSNETFNGIIQQIVSGKRFNADEIRRGAVEIYSLTRAIESYAAVYKKILG